MDKLSYAEQIKIYQQLLDIAEKEIKLLREQLKRFISRSQIDNGPVVVSSMLFDLVVELQAKNYDLTKKVESLTALVERDTIKE